MFKMKMLPEKQFGLPIGIQENSITGKVTMSLTSVGMFVERDKRGLPVIHHGKMKYYIRINDNNTFSIDYTMPMFSNAWIKTYRKSVVSMGIIAYTIQQELVKSE